MTTSPPSPPPAAYQLQHQHQQPDNGLPTSPPKVTTESAPPPAPTRSATGTTPPSQPVAAAPAAANQSDQALPHAATSTPDGRPSVPPKDEVKRRYVRLLKLTVHDLPRHPSLRALQTGRENPTAEELVGEVLCEAEEFLNDYNTKCDQLGPKASRPYRGRVAATRRLLPLDLLAQTIPSSVRAPEDTRKRVLEDLELETEAWFGRLSTHPNRRVKTEASANWVDFQFALFHDRNRRERDYTPEVKDAHLICDWDDYLAGFGRDAKLSLWEMYHKLPFPCANRRFVVLVVTARLKPRDIDWDGFITVKIPVEDIPSKSKHSSGFITGHYVSIERVRALKTNEIRWEMITASNPAGSIPPWLAKWKIPGEIAKDVGLVLKYLTKRWRKQEREDSSNSTQPSSGG